MELVPSFPAAMHLSMPTNENCLPGIHPRLLLIDVECQITSTMEVLEELKLRRCALTTKLNHVESPFLRSLPSEIIATIILYSLPPFRPVYSDVVETRPGRLIALTGVCRAFRSICLNAPALWTTICFPLRPHLSNSYFEGQMEFIDTCITRSGTQLPLSIRLGVRSLTECLAKGVHRLEITLRKAVEFLLHSRHTHRWRDIDLRLPSAAYRFFGKGIVMKNLRTLSIKPCGGQSMTDRLTLPLTGCPNHANPNSSALSQPTIGSSLRQLSLTDVYTYSLSDVPWSGLTSLDLKRFFMNECLYVLSNTPCLVNLSIRRVVHGTGALPVYPPAQESIGIPSALQLPFLESFTFTSDQRMPDAYRGLFDALAACPSLQTLRYHAWGNGEGVLFDPSTENDGSDSPGPKPQLSSVGKAMSDFLGRSLGTAARHEGLGLSVLICDGSLPRGTGRPEGQQACRQDHLLSPMEVLVSRVSATAGCKEPSLDIVIVSPISRTDFRPHFP